MSWSLQEKQKIINDLVSIAKENDLDMEYYETLARRSLRSNDFFELFVDKLAEDLDKNLDQEVDKILYSSPDPVGIKPKEEVEKPNSEGDYEDKIISTTSYHYSNKSAFSKKKLIGLSRSDGKSFNEGKNFTIRRRIGSSIWAYYLDEVDDTEGWEEYNLSLSTQPVLPEFEGLQYEEVAFKALDYEPDNILERKGRICAPIDLKLMPDLKMSDGLTGIGVDVARDGDDKTAICIRQGIHVVDFQKFAKNDTMETTGYVVQAIREWKPDYVNVEAVGGLGAAVVDRLRELEIDSVTNVCAIETQGQKIRHPRLMAYNIRTEMFLLLQELFRAGLITLPPNDDELFEELVSITFKILSDGKIMLTEKKQIKRHLGRSPDRADSLALCYYSPVEIGLY